MRFIVQIDFGEPRDFSIYEFPSLFRERDDVKNYIFTGHFCIYIFLYIFIGYLHALLFLCIFIGYIYVFSSFFLHHTVVLIASTRTKQINISLLCSKPVFAAVDSLQRK